MRYWLDYFDVLQMKIFRPFASFGERHARLKKPLIIACHALFCIVMYFVLALEAIVPLNYVLIGIFCIYALCVAILIVCYGKLVFDRFCILLLAFMLLQLVSCAVNGFSSFSRNGITMVLMALVVYEHCRQSKDNPKTFLLMATIASFCYLATYGIYYRNELLPLDFSNRLGRFFGNQNDVARHQSFSLIIGLLFSYYTKKWYFKAYGIAAALISFFFILTTGSVSNMLISALVTVIFTVWLIAKKSKTAAFVSVIAATVAAVGVLALPPMEYFRTRLLNMLASIFSDEVEGDASASMRLTGALYGLRLFFQTPLFGGSHNYLYNNYAIMTHNNMAEILSCFGLFAFIVEEVLLFWPIIKDKFKNPCVFIPMIFIIVFQFFLVSYNSKCEQIFIAVVYAFVLGRSQGQKAPVTQEYVLLD